MEMNAHIRNPPSAQERDRILRKLETFYVYIPYRNALERSLQTVRDQDTALSHWIFLMWMWVKYADAPYNIRQHWLKLWMDTGVRYSIQGVIPPFSHIWQNMREILLSEGRFERWCMSWRDLVEVYVKQIKHYESPQTQNINRLYAIRKATSIWNWNHIILHPTILHSPKGSEIHGQPLNPSQRSYYIKKEDTIYPVGRLQECTFEYILLPHIHRNHSGMTQHILLGLSLLKNGLTIQTKIRESIANQYLSDTMCSILNTFKVNNHYYTYQSGYTEYYRSQLERLESYYVQTNIQHTTIREEYNSVVAQDEWFSMIASSLDLYMAAGWMSDTLFQNMGYCLIPHRRIQRNHYPKYIQDSFVKKCYAVGKRMMEETWGNVSHHASILLFLANSNHRGTTERWKLLEKHWLSDTRFMQSNSPIYQTTQMFKTNQRLSFHLMRSGWNSTSVLSSLCHCISRELQEMKEYVVRTPTTYDFVENRVNLVNISRTLGLNTASYSVESMNRAKSLLSMLNDKVIHMFVIQEYLEQVIVWIQGLHNIPMLSVLELEESIRTLWQELQGLDATERISSWSQTPSIFTLLRNHVPWIVPLIVSDLDESKKQWWGIQGIKRELVTDVMEDAITNIPIEDPVCLPSGQYVDRSTYQILRQTTGKDPFNMASLD